MSRMLRELRDLALSWHNLKFSVIFPVKSPDLPRLFPKYFWKKPGILIGFPGSDALGLLTLQKISSRGKKRQIPISFIEFWQCVLIIGHVIVISREVVVHAVSSTKFVSAVSHYFSSLYEKLIFLYQTSQVSDFCHLLLIPFSSSILLA